jgi:hypothetical protein
MFKPFDSIFARTPSLCLTDVAKVDKLSDPGNVFDEGISLASP